MKKILLLLFFVTVSLQLVYSGIPLSSNFTVNTALPIEDRMSVANLTARDAIPTLRRWEGMLVYVVAEQKHYTLISGVTNTDWTELSGSGGGGGNLVSWQTGTVYAIGDTIIESDKIYYADTAHTSGTFSADLLAGYWTELSATDLTSATGILPIINGGTGSATQNFVDLSSGQTIAGTKTFSNTIVGSINGNASTVTTNANLTGDVTSVGNATTYNGVVPVNKGGTGSATKNFVDLSTTQVVNGNKTFSTTGATTGTIVTHNGSGDALFVDQQGAGDALNVNGDSQLVGGLVVTGATTLNTGLTGPIKAASGVLSASAINLASEVSGILPITNGGTGSSSKNFVDLTTGQTIAGLKQFSDSVGIGGAANANAILDLQSTTKAFIPPRMTTAQMNAIPSPTEGMTVHNLDFDSPAYYNGTTWVYGFGFLNLDNTYSAKISDGGVVTNENLDFIQGNCVNSSTAGQIITCTFKTGIFTQAPNCSIANASGNFNGTIVAMNTTSTTMSYIGWLTSGTSTPQASQIVCQKSGADYLSASANAYAASNGNYSERQFTGVSPNGSLTMSAAPCTEARDGGDLIMSCRLNISSSAASEARISLPNGLLTADATRVPANRYAGHWAYVSTASPSTGTVIVQPSVDYIVLGIQTASTGGGTAVNGNQISNFPIFLTARIPIQGWSNSNIIVGSFDGIEKCANEYECTDTFSAAISSSCSITRENIDWISSTTNPSTGRCSLNLNTSLLNLTQAMNCNVTVSNGTQYFATLAATSTTNIQTQTWQHDGVEVAQPVNITCQKSGVDYKPKTAKVASSIGVNVTSGIDSPKFCSFFVSNGSGAETACSSASCTTQKINGNCATTSSVTRSAAGRYTYTFNSGAWSNPAGVNCDVQLVGGGNGRLWSYIGNTFNTSIRAINFDNAASNGEDASFNVFCHGE